MFPLQAIVSQDADGVLHAPLLQRLVDLRPGKGRNATSPSCCCRSISGSKSSSQPSALCTLPGRSLAARQSPSPLKKQQRVKTGGL